MESENANLFKNLITNELDLAVPNFEKHILIPDNQISFDFGFYSKKIDMKIENERNVQNDQIIDISSSEEAEDISE